MPDQVLTRDGPVAVPLNYVVPQSGELVPLMVTASMDGTSAASEFYAVVQVIAPSGRVMGTARSDAIAAGASASVTWFPGAELEEGAAVDETFGVTAETVFYDTVNAATPLTMSTNLVSGNQYVLVVEGTYSLWNTSLGQGTPEANAQFPGSAAGRSSTQVGLDADTCFARQTGSTRPLGHSDLLTFSLDAGATYTHVEPVDGPYSAPVTGHLYRYTLTGQGHPLRIKLTDLNPPDNYGELRISLQVPSGTGSGSGAGSLVPPADTTLNGEVLTVVSGSPAWAAAAAGAITTIASPGGTIAVTNPAGPTADVDLPASGAVAGTYGDATHVSQVHVNAQGVVTAAAAIAISGIAGAGFTTLFDQTLGVDAASIDTGANGIAQTAQHLLVVYIARTDEAAIFSSALMTANGDGGAHYNRQTIRAASTSVTGSTGLSATSWGLPATGATQDANEFGQAMVFIPAYRQTTAFKGGVSLGSQSSTTAVNNRMEASGVAWLSTAAINQLTLTKGAGSVLKAGSRLTIYGMG